jgi:hypothetical protein
VPAVAVADVVAANAYADEDDEVWNIFVVDKPEHKGDVMPTAAPKPGQIYKSKKRPYAATAVVDKQYYSGYCILACSLYCLLTLIIGAEDESSHGDEAGSEAEAVMKKKVHPLNKKPTAAARTPSPRVKSKIKKFGDSSEEEEEEEEEQPTTKKPRVKMVAAKAGGGRGRGKASLATPPPPLAKKAATKAVGKKR